VSYTATGRGELGFQAFSPWAGGLGSGDARQRAAWPQLWMCSARGPSKLMAAASLCASFHMNLVAGEPADDERGRIQIVFVQHGL